MANAIVHPEGQYTVAQVGPTRDWDFKADSGVIAMRTFSVQFEGIADWVDVNRKADGEAPKVGETIDGHIEDAGKYGLKFVAKKKGGNWGGGKSSAGAAWANAYETATAIVVGYFQITGGKVKNIQEFIDKISEVAPIVKAKVDAHVGSQKEDSKDEDSKPEATTEEPKKDVVIDDVDESQLGKW